ncbi:mannose-6-phosphate isomerase, class I [Actinomyces sp. 2119]|uniref:mannose-6-phosphate isomerase n=1 Tax=Actinomyces lilanjuaniae TaxID=2321394 RepID=A0ABM6Z515_9ACTO|nr:MULTISPECIES: mannose-6-phosphate isomerase, class I [Actinomyces]AYD90243.1 mannose-6-phosphate isomerase, class I [Actinomyces lilanjuaniae]RJF41506.1 mannose-6-phosphate isomerase, class I [Actinomyces sp. 2119]
MMRLEAARQRYGWGSATAIPRLLGVPSDGCPWAEAWYGAHAAGPTLVAGGHPLAEVLGREPVRLLGDDVIRRFGAQLPFLVKLIAPARVLSLQVHPSQEQAAEGYALEEEAGVAMDSPDRNYKDPNHKPEMVLALTQFEAVAGFRAPRRAAEVLADLDSPLARRMRRTLRLNPTRFGIRQVFTDLVSAGTRPQEEAVAALVEEISERVEAGASPSPRVDSNVLEMSRSFPGDPGIAAALLLNPVTLQPGEALFVPAGSVHAYVSGLGVEVMASSDNVLRAGLTAKHVDVAGVLACVSYVAAPPVRPAPEYLSRATRAYYAPVDDFELMVTSVVPADGRLQIPGRGPRVVLAVQGSTTLTTAAGQLGLARGQAVFVGADERTLSVEGEGTLVQADVP